MNTKLTAEQLENFRAVNRRMGLPEDTVTDHTPAQLMAKSNDKIMIVSSNPEESYYKPMLISVNDIAQYNSMVGAPDDRDDSHVNYPPALTANLRSSLTENAKSAVSSEDLDTIRTAKYAYLHGNSEKVKEYEDLINAHFFPKTVAYFASDEPLVISTPMLVQGNDGVVWNYDTITIEQLGSLTATTEMNITTNKLESVGTDKVITAVGGPQVNPTAKAGKDGEVGGSGGQGSGATCQKDSSIKGTPTKCITAPGNGDDGKPGGDGGDGTNGNKGNPQLPFTTEVKEAITGNLIVRGGGGTGQNGGDGGKGGPGGPGGKAGTNCTATTGYECADARDGNQGTGGNGGNGGNAGNGGDGAAINITYNSLSGNMQSEYIGGQPGAVGQGGGAGTGGGGKTGNNGANGVAGAKSTITIRPK